MCGGTVLYEVVWQETINLDNGVYQAALSRLGHDGITGLDALKQALAIATQGGPKYNLVSCGAGTLSKAESALLTGKKKYPS